MSDRTIVVMARPLVRGAVKTRLAHGARRRRRAGGVRAPAARDAGRGRARDRAPRWCWRRRRPTPPAGRDRAGAADPLAGRDARWRRLEQRGDGLGERLAGVFADLFAAGAGRRGHRRTATAPPSRRSTWSRRSRAGAAAGSCSGPAADGGYYLIGAGRQTWDAGAAALAALLARVAHEQPAACSSTRCARPQAAGLQVAQLPLWVDVDEPADLGVLERLAGRRAAARRAARRPARGLPARHAPLRPRLPALLRQRPRRAGDELTTGRVAATPSTSASRSARAASCSSAATRCCATTSSSWSTTSPAGTRPRRGSSSTA